MYTLQIDGLFPSNHVCYQNLQLLGTNLYTMSNEFKSYIGHDKFVDHLLMLVKNG